MRLQGTVRGRTIELDERPPLEEGTRVQVNVWPTVENDLTVEERVELVRRTRGLLRATPDEVRAVLEEDPYGVG